MSRETEYRGQGAGAARLFLAALGWGLALLPPPARAQDDAAYRLDKSLEMYRAIADDARFPWTEAGPGELDLAKTGWLEERAYDAVLTFAHRFSADGLERHARHDVSYQDLVQKGRLSYKLDLIYLEGRLRRLRRAEPDDRLKENGITDVYEAWVFPRGETDPLAVFVTELPPGLDPQTDLAAPGPDRWVAVAGYYFKLLRYEAAGRDRRSPDRHEVRRAPVLIGRSLRELPEPPASDGGAAWRQTFLPVAVAGFGAVAAAVAGLAWWFRRGDRAVRRRLAERQGRNPFIDPEPPSSKE